MAKAKMPLMSMDASGALGDAIVASKWKGRNYFRIHVRPAQPRTGAQVGVRASFAGLVALIKGETDTVKNAWADAGKAEAITWLNAFVMANQKNISDGLGIQRMPTVDPTEDPPQAPTLSVSVSGRRVQFTIGRVMMDEHAYAYLLHIDTTSGFTPSWANLKLLGKAPEAGGSVVVEMSLKPGTYYAVARFSNANRLLGPNSTQVTFTIS